MTGQTTAGSPTSNDSASHRPLEVLLQAPSEIPFWPVLQQSDKFCGEFRVKWGEALQRGSSDSISGTIFRTVLPRGRKMVWIRTMSLRSLRVELHIERVYAVRL